jgi:hypothetical protein
MKYVASTTKKVLAASIMAVGLSGLGTLVTAGTAGAEPAIWDDDGYQNTPNTGSYDELTELKMEGCWSAAKSAGCDYTRLSGSYGHNGTVTSSYHNGTVS